MKKTFLAVIILFFSLPFSIFCQVNIPFGSNYFPLGNFKYYPYLQESNQTVTENLNKLAQANTSESFKYTILPFIGTNSIQYMQQNVGGFLYGINIIRKDPKKTIDLLYQSNSFLFSDTTYDFSIQQFHLDYYSKISKKSFMGINVNYFLSKENSYDKNIFITLDYNLKNKNSWKISTNASYLQQSSEIKTQTDYFQSQLAGKYNFYLKNQKYGIGLFGIYNYLMPFAPDATLVNFINYRWGIYLKLSSITINYGMRGGQTIFGLNHNFDRTFGNINPATGAYDFSLDWDFNNNFLFNFSLESFSFIENNLIANNTAMSMGIKYTLNYEK